jgi:hypothetical protein
MSKSLVLGALLLAGASAATAAEIHGTVSEGGKPLPQGVALKLDCAGASAQAQTDEFGSYSLKVGATGECKVSVDYKGASASLTVAVYEKPSRYDLALRKDGDKLVLSRK